MSNNDPPKPASIPPDRLVPKEELDKLKQEDENMTDMIKKYLDKKSKKPGKK